MNHIIKLLSCLLPDARDDSRSFSLHQTLAWIFHEALLQAAWGIQLQLRVLQLASIANLNREISGLDYRACYVYIHGLDIPG